MEAVLKRRSADDARNGVDLLDLRIKTNSLASVSSIVTKVLGESGIGRSHVFGIHILVNVFAVGFNVLQDLLEVVARPRAQAEKDLIGIAERVKPQHRLINPAVYRDVGGSCRVGFTILRNVRGDFLCRRKLDL